MDEQKRGLDKLGTVIAMLNETNRRALNLLEEQQRRQVRMVWASLAIVAIAFAIVVFGVFCTYSTLDNLSHAVKEIHYDKIEETSPGLPSSVHAD